ncbi:MULTISPECIES: transcriptional regulator SpxA [Rossellomorea]|jgi:regulatory protein spx|uniref:Global transcriptional regulator Spx n=1 Tax=Rossellomorea vietnamensis TaxID=218284 RepID=A0A6I6UPD1_9BACI|nr:MULTISPECIES: transcriptional regulator SpxA [Rossellomorea]OXS63815.1 transcriptional regulator Spx [Bacillus sp. DSM 27956]PRX78891.1 regulatory protein spx [Bacillus sp. V-88]MCA0149470.1 transcriptional regulator SpxA [Rossellomorea vietnamensis]MCC5800914.1 transcriptional regulator Spx [Rossellomorea vietnamensis]QHE60572.1 transcriptional regulator Spx [Rossellomorea vietnamensis]
MVNLFLTPSCTSCRKARAWLEEHSIEFVERNMLTEPLTPDEIKSILRLTENGTEDIISKQSKAYQELKVDIDSLPLQDLYKLIRENPLILKRPIMLDEKRLQIGYNDEEIRSFLPRKVRNFEYSELQKLAN